ncbi:MAG: ATP-dependent sacrificial sulfur transferase LarE [Ruminococcus sp.]|nr:ATP-dependent sacrificial sulfur transferase LarE [Ruminococcus sp.]
MDTLAEKKDRLARSIEAMDSAAAAFSAGVDSTFLAVFAKGILGDRLLAVTVNGAFMPRRELDEAKALCERYGIRQQIIDLDALSVREFRENTPDRCYHCKKHIFTEIKKVAAGFGTQCVLDGSNVDDLSDYRPGMRALGELGIISPLRDAGLTKADIRELSRELGLPTADKPSFACLATRIPCGDEITLQKLSMAESAEQKLYDLGFSQFRVRIHGTIARIEILPPEFPMILRTDTAREITACFASLGFTHTTLDLTGYTRGSGNGRNE